MARFAADCGSRRIRPAAALTLVGRTLSALLLSTVASHAQAAPAYRITGVILSKRSGAPVPNCHLFAREGGSATSRFQQRQGTRNRTESESNPFADTDASGHFVLVVPSPGSWRVYASGHGYRQQAYDRHENFSTAVVLTPAAPTYDVIFKLEPDSEISGFVLDEAGEGVRNAHVSLFDAASLEPDVAGGAGPMRSSTVTDDRGHYEFAALAPGDYKVSVQAVPWYASSLQGRRLANISATSDPLLDVIYPETWYPGVAEQRLAEALDLHDGEIRDAVFHLTPSPASHLRIPTPPALPSGQRGQTFPEVERVSAEGHHFTSSPIQIDAQGQLDVGGLAPGLYRVTLQSGGSTQTPTFIRVPGGAEHTLDFTAAIPVADVAVHIESDSDRERVQVSLTDVDTGLKFSSRGLGSPSRRRNMQGSASPGDHKLEVPPGRYRVVLSGDSDVYLARISVGKTPIVGRIVTLASGSTALNIKVARGRASVRGVVSVAGKPLTGAMVMLVPASFGEAGSITMLRRDQTNTDGSFLMETVIPGDYILLAIEDGWTVNWRDEATLQRYLLHGIPISLEASASLKQALTAQMP